MGKIIDSLSWKNTPRDERLYKLLHNKQTAPAGISETVKLALEAYFEGERTLTPSELKAMVREGVAEALAQIGAVQISTSAPPAQQGQAPSKKLTGGLFAGRK